MVTLIKLSQSSNAFLPIVVTLSGIDMPTKPSQFLNAFSSIEVSPVVSLKSRDILALGLLIMAAFILEIVTGFISPKTLIVYMPGESLEMIFAALFPLFS